jgi:hypothetical protein
MDAMSGGLNSQPALDQYSKQFRDMPDAAIRGVGDAVASIPDMAIAAGKLAMEGGFNPRMGQSERVKRFADTTYMPINPMMQDALTRAGVAETEGGNNLTRFVSGAMAPYAMGKYAGAVGDAIGAAERGAASRLRDAAMGPGDRYIYHTSPEKISAINSSGLFDDGLHFSNKPYVMAASKNLTTYKMKINDADYINAQQLPYHDDYSKIDDVVKEIANRYDVSDDVALDLISENKSVYSIDGIENYGDASWDIQRAGLNAAKRLGYKGLIGNDEQGATYLTSMLGREKDLVDVAAERRALSNAERGMFDGVGTLPKSEINQISLADNTPITLKKALAARASEMALNPNQRVKPRAEDALLRTTPDAYTKLLPDQITTPVPRLPEGRKYPYNERAKILDDNKEQIAQILAERARPFLGTESQYFYHMRGPFLEATRNADIADDVAIPWLNDFAGAYSATSPRTKTDQNFRNATLAMAKKAQGIPYRSVVGEGTAGMSGKPGISEKGFPMMTGKGGIHGKLLDDVDSGGINSDINPKPATFKENAAGNLAGVTVDTHAIRGALHALNEINPGSIPDEWIKSQHLAAYKKDPTKLKPATMINDTLGSVSSKKVSKQVEYAPFSDIYTRMGEILGVSPAEAQAMGWFGSGKLTGLRSEAKSLPSLFNDRLSTTSQLMGITPQEALREVVQKRSIPLLSAGALPLLGDENDTPFDRLKRKFKGAK